MKDNNLYTLDGYLKYWYYHNKTVIEGNPEKKLPIICSDQIEQNLDRLARFAGFSSEKLGFRLCSCKNSKQN